MSWLTESGLPRKARQVPVMYRNRVNGREQTEESEPHVGHFSRLGGTWWCDTCNSPYCELA